MKISEENNFAFIHIAKAAGSSISRLLEPYCIAERKNPLIKLFSKTGAVPNWKWHHYRIHAPLSVLEQRMPQKLYNKMIKFAVVRNPWDRLVSLYHFKKQGKGRQYRITQRLGNFSNWLRWMGNMPDNNPYKLQVNMLKQRDGSLGVDQILRFESLEQQWDELSKTIGVTGKLPKINSSKHDQWQEYYSNDDADYVEKIWKEDIKTFEYDFNATQK